MMTDPVADFLTRIRNATMMKHSSIQARNSKILCRISQILKDNGYIENFTYDGDGIHKEIILKLKYDTSGKSIIVGLNKISKPGLRIYKHVGDLPKILGGLGLAIVSTSSGVMSCKEAKNKNLGGEVICSIW